MPLERGAPLLPVKRPIRKRAGAAPGTAYTQPRWRITTLAAAKSKTPAAGRPPSVGGLRTRASPPLLRTLGIRRHTSPPPAGTLAGDAVLEAIKGSSPSFSGQCRPGLESPAARIDGIALAGYGRPWPGRPVVLKKMRGRFRNCRFGFARDIKLLAGLVRGRSGAAPATVTYHSCHDFPRPLQCARGPLASVAPADGTLKGMASFVELSPLPFMAGPIGVSDQAAPAPRDRAEARIDLPLFRFTPRCVLRECYSLTHDVKLRRAAQPFSTVGCYACGMFRMMAITLVAAAAYDYYRFDAAHIHAVEAVLSNVMRSFFG